MNIEGELHPYRNPQNQYSIIFTKAVANTESKKAV